MKMEALNFTQIEAEKAQSKVDSLYEEIFDFISENCNISDPKTSDTHTFYNEYLNVGEENETI